jgi:hypothetical protein
MEREPGETPCEAQTVSSVITYISSRDTKSPLDKLLSMAKYFHRGVHPFHDIGLVMHVGSQSMWATPVSTVPSNTVVVPAACVCLCPFLRSSHHTLSELEEQKRYKNAFDKMLAISPESLEALHENYKANTHWAGLVQKVRSYLHALTLSFLL